MLGDSHCCPLLTQAASHCEPRAQHNGKDSGERKSDNYGVDQHGVVPRCLARQLTSCPSAAGRGPGCSRREPRRAAARRLQGLVMQAALTAQPLSGVCRWLLVEGGRPETCTCGSAEYFGAH